MTEGNEKNVLGERMCDEEPEWKRERSGEVVTKKG